MPLPSRLRPCRVMKRAWTKHEHQGAHFQIPQGRITTSAIFIAQFASPILRGVKYVENQDFLSVGGIDSYMAVRFRSPQNGDVAQILASRDESTSVKLASIGRCGSGEKKCK